MVFGIKPQSFMELNCIFKYELNYLHVSQQKGSRRSPFFNFGRGERIRTFDPLVPNQMRYQAALRPDQ